MKKHLLLLLGLSLFSFHPALAEDSSQTSTPASKEAQALPRFDLDFPGGPVGDLVKAIEKATGRPLNAIIPDNSTNSTQDAFSVHQVTVAQLFEAITAINKDTRRFPDGIIQSWSSGFRTEGVPNENSIWYYFDDKPGDPDLPDVCRFYELAPYLEAGFKVEDITTAIETGLEMTGVSPEDAANCLKYHKETKLLIAKCNTDQMKMIDGALAELSKAAPKPALLKREDPPASKTP
jgi:hypothetical protein